MARNHWQPTNQKYLRENDHIRFTTLLQHPKTGQLYKYQGQGRVVSMQKVDDGVKLDLVTPNGHVFDLVLNRSDKLEIDTSFRVLVTGEVAGVKCWVGPPVDDKPFTLVRDEGSAMMLRAESDRQAALVWASTQPGVNVKSVGTESPSVSVSLGLEL